MHTKWKLGLQSKTLLVIVATVVLVLVGALVAYRSIPGILGTDDMPYRGDDYGYTTLDRMEKKGFVRWTPMVSDSPRRVAPIRLFKVTREGLAALRESRGALEALWNGMDEVVQG